MTTSKTFRLFISSTFNDFRREREVLQTKIFPHIKSYASSLGYTFQPIDLRWGVSAEAQLDQKTLELCLEEVRACKSHPHPNFLIMAGDRYGWIPLPYAIEQHEYETLCSLMSLNEQSQLNEWYKLDLNQLPASYILKERSGEYVDYDTWGAIENILRILLQSAVKASSLSEKQQRKYFLSATEAEVEEGIIPYLNETKKQQELLSKNPELKTIDPDYIFGFLRTIDPSSQTGKGDKFIISDGDYQEAQEFKGRIHDILPESNLLNIQTTQSDDDSLDEKYLEEFESQMIIFLESQIDAQKAEEDQKTYTPLQIEQDAQSYYALQKRKDFLETPELKQLLDKIQTYIDTQESDSAFILYGPSGRGKSSLMSMAINQSDMALTHKVLYRFIGATPHSGSSKEILTSMFEELEIDVRSEAEKARAENLEMSLDANKDSETFEDFSYRIHDQIMSLKENIVLFIDAIDQISNDDQFLWLPKTLPENVKIIISALDDASYSEDSKYFQTLKPKTTHIHEISAFSDPAGLLTALLEKEERTLQPHQENYFLTQFSAAASPLYVLMAAQEIRHWKSSDTVGEDEHDKNLASTQKGIIAEFISNLIKLHHHNPAFVQKVLGYLYASRDGLSESELLQLLSTNEAFIEAMAPETFHENKTKELPMVHWSRLHTQLKPFLSTKSQDNEELMYFFHREFEDAIKDLPTQRYEHEAIITATQKLITQYQNDSFESNRLGKLYATLITEYELRFYTRDEQKLSIEHKSTQKRFAQFIAEFAYEGWIDTFISIVNSIGIEHQLHNHTYESIAYNEIFLRTLEPLYSKNPDRWAENYTAALSNLAISYKDVNRTEEAMVLEEKSLKILEALYAANPDRWAERYTKALNYLATSYRGVNRTEEAIVLEEKTLQIREALYAANPDRWAENYTGALNNLAISYKDVNRTEEAMVLEEKTLQILEALYAANPDRWAEGYTAALNNLAISYKDVNRTEEAIVLAEKSLQILEALYAANPDRWAEDYTVALNNLANPYEDVNRTEEAIVLEEKSLQILEALYAANPDRWAEKYTAALNNLANSYNDVNRMDEAIVLAEKSLQIREALYAANPDRWAEDYTAALNNLANSYNDVNRTEEAIVLAEKTLQIREALYTANPDRWAEKYTAALYNLAISYKDVNRTEEAMVLEEKSLKILEALYTANPDRWAEKYTAALNNLAMSYNDVNRMDEAIVLAEKSLQIREALYAANPDRWAEDYTAALNNLAIFYKKNGMEDKWAQIKIVEKHFKHAVTIEDLCNLAKFDAYKSQNNEIEMIHIIHAMSYINLNRSERDKFSQLFDLSKLTPKKKALICIDVVKEMDNLPYEEEIEELIEEMMAYYQDKAIGRFW